MAGPIAGFARRIGGALFARGRFVPAVTRIVQGRTEIVSPEVVVPKGILRSKTVWSGLLAAFFAFANAQGWHLWFTAEQASQVLDWLTVVFGGAAVAARVTATMPTRGPSMGP